MSEASGGCHLATVGHTGWDDWFRFYKAKPLHGWPEDQNSDNQQDHNRESLFIHRNFLIRGFGSFDRVEASLVPGVTFRQTFHRHPTAARGAILAEGILGIM